MDVLYEMWVISKLEDVVDQRIIAGMNLFRKKQQPITATTELNESGEPICPPDAPSKPTLGLKSVLDIFILLLVGSAIASVLLMGEVLYYRYKRWCIQDK